MLTLTRRTGGIIHIGDDITITVRKIRGNQVALSINAPKNIAVHRSEIYNKIQDEIKDENQQ